ncbi:xanthine phosphoribosyltransferase [Lucifera butyrica]|uniref:Xanthine phosphoribosyltransferase n=1 Tax=Lucifera butyrica TaxID=1351585 RepID=A0A498RC72_9FIRM|nr:xanthine phosphoribosyltransferase [Lucifera butyrica]VBB06748.1 xanthine phosphoribosyltransferase [Lucifera butyrica]
MELLKNKIRQEGTVLNNSVLKVDSFLNHQIDPVLMFQMGEEFAHRFQDAGATKILTIESSGIAVALATGFKMGLPVVFARKKKSVLMNEAAYTAKVFSFTKKESSEITVLKKFLAAGEKILIIDDFLASGEAALGLTEIVRQAGSTVAGIGIVIEKSFQAGAAKLQAANYHLESLVRIGSFENGQVLFL